MDNTDRKKNLPENREENDASRDNANREEELKPRDLFKKIKTRWSGELWNMLTSPAGYDSEERRKLVRYVLIMVAYFLGNSLLPLSVFGKLMEKEIKSFFHFVKTFEKAGICRKGEGYFPTLAYMLALNKDMKTPISKLYANWRADAAAELQERYTRRENVRFRMGVEEFKYYQMALCLLYASEKKTVIRGQIREAIKNAYFIMFKFLEFVFSAIGSKYHCCPLLFPVLVAFQLGYTADCSLFGVTEVLMVAFELMPLVGFGGNFLSGTTVADIYFAANGMAVLPTGKVLTENAVHIILGSAKRIMNDRELSSFPGFLEEALSIIRQSRYCVPDTANLVIARMRELPRKQIRSLVGNFLLARAQKHSFYIEISTGKTFDFSREYYEKFSSVLMRDSERFIEVVNNIYTTGVQLFFANIQRELNISLNDENVLEAESLAQEAWEMEKACSWDTFPGFARVWSDFFEYASDQFLWQDQCGEKNSAQTSDLDSMLASKIEECRELKEKCERLENQDAKRSNDKKEIKSLREENAALMKENRDQEKSLEEARKDRKELASLRELMFDLSQDEEDAQVNFSEEQTKQMAEYLETKVRGAFLGGSESFHSKISTILPSWRKYPPKCAIPADVIRNLDALVICTDYLDHASYKTAMNVVRNSKCRPIPIHNKNVNIAVNTIYRLMKDKTVS